MPFPNRWSSARAIFETKPSNKPEIQPPQGNDKQRAKKNRRRNAKLTKRRLKSLSLPEREKEFADKSAAAYERRELFETKRLLKVLRQYTHWYLARAKIDGMAKYHIYQASSEAKRLEALSSMSEEEHKASMEWLRNYVSELSAAKDAGLWEVDTREGKGEKAFAVGDLVEALKGIEAEEVSVKEPWHIFDLPFRPGSSTTD